MKKLSASHCKLLLSFFIFLFSMDLFAFENLFYILRSNSSGQMSSAKAAFSSMNQHQQSIDIIVPQSYQIDKNGLMWGFIDPEVLELSRKNNIKLMALVTNTGFDKEQVHQFLMSPAAEERALQSLLQICKQDKLYGLQLDFEMVKINDRDALTQFFKAASDLLHKNGYKISFAVAPIVYEGPMPSEFLKRIYENWEGAYNLKALGEFGDFITVMAYNQHAGKTTPGPVAGMPWVEATIKYTLTLVPANKISLGIPLYSEQWTTSPNLDDPLKKIEAHGIGLSYEKIQFIANKFHASWIWEPRQKNNYSVFENNWLNEYLFLEDAKSFKEKVAFAKQYNLHGISAFCLGVEDPAIWNELMR